MRVAVITPAQPVIGLDEAKRHLRVDHFDDDALISRLVAAATQHVAAPTGWLGRSVGAQTLELSMHGFAEQCDGDLIALPFRPLVSVSSVKYVSVDGVDTTLAGEQWRVVEDYFLAPAYGLRWPPTRVDRGAVTIRYVAGYPDIPPETEGSDPVRTVPEPIVGAILLYVGAWYNHREAIALGASFSALPPVASAEALLSTFHIWSL